MLKFHPCKCKVRKHRFVKDEELAASNVLAKTGKTIMQYPPVPILWQIVTFTFAHRMELMRPQWNILLLKIRRFYIAVLLEAKDHKHIRVACNNGSSDANKSGLSEECKKEDKWKNQNRKNSTFFKKLWTKAFKAFENLIHSYDNELHILCMIFEIPKHRDTFLLRGCS